MFCQCYKTRLTVLRAGVALVSDLLVVEPHINCYASDLDPYLIVILPSSSVS